MKLKSNQTRTYDGDGYKKRAACLCFRSESEEEVRRRGRGSGTPEGVSGGEGGWGGERRGPEAGACRPAAGHRRPAAVHPGSGSALGSSAHVHGAQAALCGGAEGRSLPQGCGWPRGGGCGRALAATSQGQPFDSNVELMSPCGGA